ncbi:hypothetical protein L1987_43833 [Smallanthus sonchifolius]|uniref:Uncharacterized protein n=1 Tax=Smallanthus sonchifolius TaxID=185202 RepID=A0ACB9GNT4_9ASTR|nr:hypothetical protein L1987_43833 [Smallanthus sonchifolius]
MKEMVIPPPDSATPGFSGSGLRSFGIQQGGNQIHVEHPQFIFPVEETGDCSSVSIQLQKPYGDEHEYSSSFSSCEVDENECKPSGIFCMWRWKADVVFAKSKKSSSTGSGSHGSRRWKILSSRRRSNTEEVTGKLKTTTSSSPSFHELFYVQKRAEQKGDKMKTFLPCKQDLLGFFVNINRIRNKKFPF